MAVLEKIFRLTDDSVAAGCAAVPPSLVDAKTSLVDEFVDFLSKRDGVDRSAALEVISLLRATSYGQSQTIAKVPGLEAALMEVDPPDHCLALPQECGPWKLKRSTAPYLLGLTDAHRKEAVCSLAPAKAGARHVVTPPSRLADRRPRDLEWIAIRTVVKDCLNGLGWQLKTAGLYKVWLIDFRMSVLEQRVAAQEPPNLGECEKIAAALKILGRKAAKHAEMGLPLAPDLVERLKRCRGNHHALLIAVVEQQMHRNVPSNLRIVTSSFQTLDLDDLSGDELMDMNDDNRQKFEQRVFESLRPLEIPRRPSDARTAKKRLDSARKAVDEPSGKLSLRVAMQSVEVYLLSLKFQESGFKVDHTELRLLHHSYRVGAEALLGDDADKVQRRSKSAIVALIVYCCIDAVACQAHPRVGQFGMTVNPADLMHLAVLGKPWVEAVQRVHAYLLVRTRPEVLFSLAASKQTWKFARQYAGSCASMRAIWQAEQESMAAREEAHWEVVQEKQATARRLRAEIKQLQQQVPPLEAEKRQAKQVEDALSVAHRNLCSATASRTRARSESERAVARQTEEQCEAEVERRQTSVERLPKTSSNLEREIGGLKSTITLRETELEQARRCPPAVYQPLPKEEEKAYEVIFFLYMPDELRTLAQASFMAQQTLRPIDMLRSHPDQEHRWSEYYNEMQLHNESYHRPLEKRHGKDAAVKLCAVGAVPSEQEVNNGVYVDSWARRSDGVFYPRWQPAMSWQSDGTKVHFDDSKVEPGRHLFHVNPWTEVKSTDVASFFAFTFSERNLQKYVPIVDNDVTRGNLGLAQQRDAPREWARPAWLAFSGLRAYPCLQFSRLAAALDGHKFPLGDSRVQALIQQTLAQIGELDQQSRQLWRKDLFEGSGLSSMGRILSELCEQAREASGRVDEVPVLALVAGHLSQWLPSLCRSCEALAQATVKWAKEQAQSIATVPQQDVGGVRQKICTFCFCSVLCCRFIPLTRSAATSLGEAIVLFNHHRHLNEKGSDSMMGQWRQLQEVVAERAAVFLEVAEADGSILSAAVAAVIEDVPANTKWTRMHTGTSSCFCTDSGPNSGSSYQINLLTGVVLKNGYCPSRLPKAIYSHPLYKRSFLERRFDVTMERPGVFRTSSMVRGRFYEFSQQEATICIYEISSDKKTRLRLVDGSAVADRDLPEFLVGFFSHWQHDELLVFRPPNIERPDFHRVSWILNWSTGTGIRVPSHKQGEEADQTATFSSWSQKERLVPMPEALSNIISNFEDPAWVHCFESSDGPLVLELPRYKLTFELSADGEVRSRDYKGFVLAENQTLRSLPSLETYLILKKRKLHAPDQVCLLVPKGTVHQGEGGGVAIKARIETDPNGGPPRCEALRFDKHPRFGSFEAESVAARLQLAAMYAAAGSIAGDGSSDMAGVEVAMDLVRKSWVNRPLQTDEQQALENVQLFAKGSPGLQALCYELKLSSQQLDFLHDGSSSKCTFSRCRELAARCAQESAEHRGNWRRMLSEEESSRLFHRRCCSSFLDPVPEDLLVDAEPCEGDVNIATDFENQLATKLQQSEAPVPDGQFPIRVKANPSPLEVRLLRETKASWDQNRRQLGEEPQLAKDASDPSFYLECLEKARGLLETKLAYVRACLRKRPPVRRLELSIQVQLSSSAAVEPTLAELCKMVVDEDLICMANPYLSEAGRRELRKGLLQLLQAYVLEDKLLRLLSFAESGQEAALLQELKVRRVYDVLKHPEWLVFEVSNGLQIRSVQVGVANQFLTGSTGEIVQLNMGEGKTRVILPMLVLAAAKGQTLVRVTALQQLLEDLANHLQSCLTASPLNHKVFRMPFNRDVNLTEESAKKMLHSMQFCMRVGGVMVVAPEHRLSLQLKRLELLAKKEPVHCADEFDKVPTWDILDESDEILSYVRQVVYAIGVPQDLPDGRERWQVSQALLRALRQCCRDKTWQGLAPDVLEQVLCDAPHPECPEAFGDIRFLPGQKLNASIQDIKAQVLKQLFDHPPPDFMWLTGYTNGLREALEQFALEAETTAELPANLPKDQRATILALRGYLAGGVFQRCLEKRFHSTS